MTCMFIYVLICCIVSCLYYLILLASIVRQSKCVKKRLAIIISACINGYACDETPKSLK